jgi:hypothetical protein
MSPPRRRLPAVPRHASLLAVLDGKTSGFAPDQKWDGKARVGQTLTLVGPNRTGIPSQTQFQTKADCSMWNRYFRSFQA